MTAIPATLRFRREGALRSRAARGDAIAFAAAYERHHQALYRYCRSILRHEEDAQDALQSTFTRAFAALQEERRDFELRPWLFRIAHNEAISILRRRRATDELADVPDEHAFEDRIAEREELRLLQMDLADLPDRQRAALVLRELNGLSHAEIGVVLELSPGAVKQAIFEARTALFSCREGREMECHDVRRMLSDGDGRVLRGRGIRAHLRSCPDCARFRRTSSSARARSRRSSRRCRSAPPRRCWPSCSARGRRRSCSPAWRSSAAAERRSRWRCATRASWRRRPPRRKRRRSRSPSATLSRRPWSFRRWPRASRSPRPPWSRRRPSRASAGRERDRPPRRERPRRERRRERPAPTATVVASPTATPPAGPATPKPAEDPKPKKTKPEKREKAPKPHATPVPTPARARPAEAREAQEARAR